jgi:hypothetical protein
MGSIPATKSEETHLHRRFRHLRLKGEWFKITDEILTFIYDFERAGQMIPGEPYENYMRRVQM